MCYNDGNYASQGVYAIQFAQACARIYVVLDGENHHSYRLSDAIRFDASHLQQ
jgi:very-short-patch-repair endonuclease